MLGPALILLFGLSQAARDVYLGGVFQGVSLFAVIIVAFTISTVVFGVIALARRPDDFGKLAAQWPVTVAMVITTAMSWPFYFFALTYVDPSVVNTIHSGMGPLTAVGLALAGSRLAGPALPTRPEYVFLAGIAATIAALWLVVLAGKAGVRPDSQAMQAAGLAAVLVSGSMITVSLLLSKKLHDAGIGSEAVTSVRYLLLLAVAAAVEATRTGPPAHLDADNLPMLAVATTVLMVLPLFALQVGIERTQAITAHVIRALGPVFVFALEQFDSRIAYAPAVLACIAAYSVLAIAANLAHGRARRGAPG